MTDERAPSRELAPSERGALDRAIHAAVADKDAGWYDEREIIWKAAREYERRAALATAPQDGELEARLLMYANDIAAHGAGDEDTCRECLTILRTLWRDATNAARPAPPKDGEVAADETKLSGVSRGDTRTTKGTAVLPGEPSAMADRNRPDGEVAAVIEAAKTVTWFDWSDNDEDAVQAVDDLRKALARLSAPVPDKEK